MSDARIRVRDGPAHRHALGEAGLFLPSLVAGAELSAFLGDALAGTSRRVTVGNGKECWTEYKIGEDCTLGAFLRGDTVFALAREAAPVMLKRPPAVWAQSYQPGERIAWHRDDSGAIQLLLCLEAPPAEYGGVFCMRFEKREIHLALKPGDAVLFRASAIPHSTTRLIARAPAPLPPRVTAVARFYAAMPG